MSLSLREKLTTGALRGFVGSTRTTPVATRARRGIVMLAPAFCLNVIVDVTTSGKTWLAASPDVLPAAPGINAENLAQKTCDCPGWSVSVAPALSGVSDWSELTRFRPKNFVAGTSDAWLKSFGSLIRPLVT